MSTAPSPLISIKWTPHLLGQNRYLAADPLSRLLLLCLAPCNGSVSHGEEMGNESCQDGFVTDPFSGCGDITNAPHPTPPESTLQVVIS